MSTRWTRVMVAAGLTLLSIFVAAPAQADDCPPLDATCLAGEVVDEVGSLDGVIEDTVEIVSGTVDQVAEGTKGTVDETLGGAVDEPPAGGGDDGGNTGGGGNGGGDGGSGHGHRDGSADRSADTAGLLGFGSAARPPIAIGTGSGDSHGTSIVPANRPVGEQRRLPERFGATAARAVKSMAIVFVLLLAAIGFVLIQDRLDKKDPRLALAPLESDLARFD